MSRRSIISLATLCVVAAAALAWWVIRVPTVPAVIVRETPLVRTLQFSARAATTSRVDIGSALTGRVVMVTVVEGALVKQGDVLVRLESNELRAALEQAQASERQALARLSGLRSTGRSAAQAALAQTDSVLQAAQADLQRTQDLVAQGFLSQSRLDEAQRAAAVARAQQASARAQLSANAEQGTEVAQAQAQWALAASAIAAARARLAQAVLVAPTDAKVLSRMVEPGQIVQPGKALLSLALAGPLQLVAQVDERYLEQLQIGQAAIVLADAYPDQRFEAQVQSIAPQVDTQRGAVEIKLSPRQPPDFLREDMTLSVEVETARRARALVVPIAALRNEESSGKSTVRIHHEGKVQERTVRLGLRSLDAVEVVDGLVAGELVLVGTTPKPGQRVHADIAASPPSPKTSIVNEGIGSAMTSAMGR
jgi:HlyD family secretion protein